jgi:outer membrane protein TolC
LADESFKAGMCSSSDLMAAQTAWMKAQNEVIDARIETVMGQVYLNQALGK